MQEYHLAQCLFSKCPVLIVQQLQARQVENYSTFQKGAGVTVDFFQASKHTSDRSGLVTRHPGNPENRAKACFGCVCLS